MAPVHGMIKATIVDVGVNVDVAVAVCVNVGVKVGVEDGVTVGVEDGVSVNVGDGVIVGVGSGGHVSWSTSRSFLSSNVAVSSPSSQIADFEFQYSLLSEFVPIVVQSSTLVCAGSLKC